MIFLVFAKPKYAINALIITGIHLSNAKDKKLNLI